MQVEAKHVSTASRPYEVAYSLELGHDTPLLVKSSHSDAVPESSARCAHASIWVQTHRHWCMRSAMNTSLAKLWKQELFQPGRKPLAEPTG